MTITPPPQQFQQNSRPKIPPPLYLVAEDLCRGGPGVIYQFICALNPYLKADTTTAVLVAARASGWVGRLDKD